MYFREQCKTLKLPKEENTSLVVTMPLGSL